VSLVGFSARNHPQQSTRHDVDDRRTPASLFDRLHAAHAFTLDVCATADNAMLPAFYSPDDDGLTSGWGGERVWCNPPYSSIAPWIRKAWDEMLFNRCALVVMLLPANRTEQVWWQRYVEPFRDRVAESGVRLSTEFLAGRMRFGHPAGYVKPKKGDRPPFGNVLVRWERV
jgi:phage N-6-adenine-methyltransferase